MKHKSAIRPKRINPRKEKLDLFRKLQASEIQINSIKSTGKDSRHKIPWHPTLFCLELHMTTYSPAGNVNSEKKKIYVNLREWELWIEIKFVSQNVLLMCPLFYFFDELPLKGSLNDLFSITNFCPWVLTAVVGQSFTVLIYYCYRLTCF